MNWERGDCINFGVGYIQRHWSLWGCLCRHPVIDVEKTRLWRKAWLCYCPLLVQVQGYIHRGFKWEATWPHAYCNYKDGISKIWIRNTVIAHGSIGSCSAFVLTIDGMGLVLASMVAVKITGCGARLPGFNQPRCLTASPWASRFTPSCLSFLIY